MHNRNSHPARVKYLDELAQGVEAWTAQGVSIAVTGGGYNNADNQPYEKAWQKNPIRNVGDFWRRVEEVRFEVRGIAAIHGADFGTFALDMDKDMGRADFEWLMENGYVTDDDLIFDSPGGVHVVYQHDLRLIEGQVTYSKEYPGCIVLDGFDGPRGDGSLHVTLRGRVGANVTKVMPTRRPGTGEKYTARHGWEYHPPPLPEWFRLPVREVTVGDPTDLRSVPDKYIRTAILGEARRVLESTPGVNRNNTLNDAAFSLGRFVRAGRLTEEKVESYLLRAAAAKGLDESEALRTIRSGIDGAMTNGSGR